MGKRSDKYSPNENTKPIYSIAARLNTDDPSTSNQVINGHGANSGVNPVPQWPTSREVILTRKYETQHKITFILFFIFSVIVCLAMGFIVGLIVPNDWRLCRAQSSPDGPSEPIDPGPAPGYGDETLSCPYTSTVIEISPAQYWTLPRDIYKSITETNQKDCFSVCENNLDCIRAVHDFNASMCYTVLSPKLSNVTCVASDKFDTLTCSDVTGTNCTVLARSCICPGPPIAWRTYSTTFLTVDLLRLVMEKTCDFPDNKTETVFEEICDRAYKIQSGGR